MVKNRAIALGFFDGIHVGHATLLNMARKRAEELGCVPAVITFDTHPEKLISGNSVPLINSPVGRVDIIERLFLIDDVIILHFDHEMRTMPWEDFAEVLIKDFGAVYLVMGQDFRFGFKGEGDSYKLSAKCAGMGVSCDILPDVEIDGIKVSSSYIRELISKGDMETANKFLGHPYTLVDTVRYGYKLGRTIGAPTINMVFPENVLVPAHGVYATKVFIAKTAHLAVTNIGVRPTVGRSEGRGGGEGGEVTVESFILDYDGDLYGRQVRVEFHKFLRPEKKFKDIGELKEHIEHDARTTREYFAEKNLDKK